MICFIRVFIVVLNKNFGLKIIEEGVIFFIYIMCFMYILFIYLKRRDILFLLFIIYYISFIVN